jgi:DNA polymerase delta subunit 1
MSLEDLQDAPDFEPVGLPSGVYEYGTEPRTTRAMVFGYEPWDPDMPARDLVVSLHTFDVEEKQVAAEAPAHEYERLQTASAQEMTDFVSQCEIAASEKLADTDEAPGCDAASGQCKVYITAHTPEGHKLGFIAPFWPCCYVELPCRPGAEAWFTDVVVRALTRSLRVPSSSVRIDLQRRPRFLGYVPDDANPLQRKLFTMARLSFPNSTLTSKAAHALRQDWGRPLMARNPSTGSYDAIPKLSVYEDGIDVKQQFLDWAGITPSAWHCLRFPSPTLPRRSREMLVDAEFFVADARWFTPWTGSEPPPASVAPTVVVVLDAEMNSGRKGRMARAFRPTNAVVCVSLVFATVGARSAHLKEYVEYERRAFVLGNVCAPIPGVIVVLFDNEFDLIAAVRDELFVHHRVDVVAGHNLVRFDMEYLACRIELFGHDASKRFLRFGTLLAQALSLHAADLNSSAFGTNRLSKLDGAGFVYIDTMLVCKVAFKLRQNTLSAAAEHFLGGSAAKFDMPYDLIPEVCSNSVSDHWRKLVAYCVQDSVLVLRLLQQWDNVKDWVAQSRIINIPMAANVQCGQQVRVRDYMMRDAHGPPFHMVMNGVNVRDRSKPLVQMSSAVGGYVLDNVQGLHDKPVIVLDFASLYPSVQMANNLCWSTVNMGDIKPHHLAAGLKVKRIETPTGCFEFVQNVPGVFPRALQALKDARNDYKRVMKANPYGSAEYQNADNAQKATKIVMNSGYGTANCDYGIMPCKPLGTSTCWIGRELNIMANEFCSKTFGAETLYGDTDSIMIYFPEPEHVKNGTRLERLKYALHMGETAETTINEFFFAQFDTHIVQTECEKCYFPFLSSGKKTYAGLKFEPGDERGVTEDLGHMAGFKSGKLECKGLRTVRRDVPAFVRSMTNELLNALFFLRNEDEFWNIVHTYAERIARVELPLTDYVQTAELKGGYEGKLVSPQAAVSYSREYRERGAGFEDGDRVPFVFVDEPDNERMTRPPWMNDDLAKARVVAERARLVRMGKTEDDVEFLAVSATFDTVDAFDDDEDEFGKGSSVAGGSCADTKAKLTTLVESVDDKKAKHARHPDEVLADPEHNHLDIEHYIDCVCAVLEQLMPKAKKAREELVAFGSAYKHFNRRVRQFGQSGGMGVFSVDTSSHVSSLPKLSHRKPAEAPELKAVSLRGHGSVVTVEKPSKKSAVAKKPAAKPAPSLRSFFGAK